MVFLALLGALSIGAAAVVVFVAGGSARKQTNDTTPTLVRVARWAAVFWLVGVSALYAIGLGLDFIDQQHALEMAAPEQKSAMLTRFMSDALGRFVFGAVVAVPLPVVVLVACALFERRRERAAPQE